MSAILNIEVRQELDVVLARQRARQVAGLIGFEPLDQTRIATAVSEIARNAVQYAGGGTVEIAIRQDAPAGMEVVIRDHGPGIADVKALLEGRATFPVGMGLGIVGARRVTDRFEIESGPGPGTTVRLVKYFGKRIPTGTDLSPRRIIDELAKRPPANPMEETLRQNQELLQALAELRGQQSQAETLNGVLEETNRDLQRHRAGLADLNRELEETNRGVLALHTQLEERAVSLQNASELKSKFLSYVSHEFRTPLNSIRSLAGFLLDPADGALSVERQRQVQYIRKSAESLTLMVDDLLDLAKVEAGKLDVRVETFEVDELFGTLRGMFRPLIDPSSPISLVFESGEGVTAMKTDEAKVAQILRNFISNALKYTEVGEVRVSAARGAEGHVVFSVSDTGIGIAEADQSRIFEEFAQVEGPRQNRVKGTGLGLPLTRKLAELLGGRVTLESRPGVGSTFSAAIPRQFAQTADPAASPGASHRESRRGIILIVDDDEIARYVLVALLAESTDLVTVEARDAKDALRRIADHRPDVIFLDLMMPDMNGLELVDRLKADPGTRAIPVIAYTSEVIDADELSRAGFDAVLRKGDITRDRAAEGVRAVLGRIGLPRPPRARE